MQINIKFNYSEITTPPRCRKPKSVHFNDGELTHHIPEVSDLEAPVAIRSTGLHSFDSDLRFIVEYRWYKGKLWTSVNLRGCSPTGYTSGGNDYTHHIPNSIIDLTQSNYDYCNQLHLDSFKSKSDVIDGLLIQLDSMLLINGVMYRPAGEPRYVVVTFGLGRNYGGTALFAESSYNLNIGNDSYFNLFDRDKAMASATDIAKKRGDTKSLPMKLNMVNEFEILIPEAIQVNPDQQHGEGDTFINALKNIAEVLNAS